MNQHVQHPLSLLPFQHLPVTSSLCDELTVIPFTHTIIVCITEVHVTAPYNSYW